MESRDVVFVSDAVHLDMSLRYVQVEGVSVVSNAKVVVVGIVEVVYHAINRLRKIIVQFDLALDALLEHPIASALEILGLRCDEAATNIVLLLVANNGEIGMLLVDVAAQSQSVVFTMFNILEMITFVQRLQRQLLPEQASFCQTQDTCGAVGLRGFGPLCRLERDVWVNRQGVSAQ